jgi:hypothetical protein
MTKKSPATKEVKKTVKNVIKDVVKKKVSVDPAVALAARDKYRSSAKFPKARTAGR